MDGHVQSNGMRIKCPHCGGKSSIRSSLRVSEITTEHSCICNNHVECGHTWVAVFSAIRTIHPSRMPNSKVHIPLSKNSSVRKPVSQAG